MGRLQTAQKRLKQSKAKDYYKVSRTVSIACCLLGRHVLTIALHFAQTMPIG